jgi:beta-aspartyl-peptidase (threonine type)
MFGRIGLAAAWFATTLPEFMSPLHATDAPGPIAIAVHGGAGTLLRAEMPPGREAAHRQAMEDALRAGHRVLAAGGAAVDAVIAAVVVLEDSPLFNAGRGAVFTRDGTVELDASLMDGAAGTAGAVAGVRTVKNPIRLARAVMEHSPHVLLVGEGAEGFAETRGFEMVSPDYFKTDRRREELEELLAAERAGQAAVGERRLLENTRFGTVGAVALDASGRLAAATSTGGMTGKRWGRVGDSPIIGAGTFADTRCAVSCTGHGEFFIRGVVAHDVAAMVGYAGLSLAQAAEKIVHQKLPAAGGRGGLIAIDAAGAIAMPFNTSGMYRGAIHPDGRLEIAIFRE